MKPIRAVSIEAMQAIDSQAIEQMGIPRLLLMEHAGLALARETCRLDFKGPVAVVCGKGFNGGDGLAAARHLSNEGYAVHVLLVCEPADLRDEPRQFYEMLRHLDIPVTVVGEERAPQVFAQFGCIVDALLGIGIRNEVREPFFTLIQSINTSRARIISADVPSGLNADTGEVLGVAVKAHKTVTFGLIEKGCLRPGAKDYIGDLVVDPISFPPELLREGLK